MAGAQQGSNSLRVWLKPRGTTKLEPLMTSVLVPKDCLVDDLKWYLKEELKPLLNKFPKPAIQIYSYNAAADDFHLQSPTKIVAKNPNPEVLLETPGLSSDCPMYWDWDQDYEEALKEHVSA
eukprot:TRINITY_DN17700_c0_g1_i1.p1 TRINITY_DN17700_c0_g1~~TRINITY_DN17700_c0_g1_i1.p1  ORF type:complete len:136 (+),score=36.42 TRINITY_DN17700_c0_g1_i1:44-409(+)